MKLTKTSTIEYFEDEEGNCYRRVETGEKFYWDERHFVENQYFPASPAKIDELEAAKPNKR